jgi:hypothetical protein
MILKFEIVKFWSLDDKGFMYKAFMNDRYIPETGKSSDLEEMKDKLDNYVKYITTDMETVYEVSIDTETKQIQDEPWMEPYGSNALHAFTKSSR